MMRIAALGFVFAIACLPSCSNKNEGDKRASADLSQLTDNQKIDWIMKNMKPDSAGKFLGRVLLGEVKDVKLDTFAMAILYLYDNYRDETVEQFTTGFDNFKKSLPLSKKMELYLKTGDLDTLNTGYQLGLEYVAKIRDTHMKVSEIEKEINELRETCERNRDTLTFGRFTKGFVLALQEDSGRDLRQEVYQRFVTLQ